MRTAYETIILHRDCEGILVPAGLPITLQKDTEVTVTQALGNAYTVHVNGNLVRIDGTEADALGKEPTKPLTNEDGSLSLEDMVWMQLKTCFDPEIPVNIVDLGLIYNCRITPLTDGGENGDHNIFVEMTLTAPGCGMGPVLAMDVKQKLKAVPGVNEVEVELVFEPPWSRDMMSDAARLQLGML